MKTDEEKINYTVVKNVIICYVYDSFVLTHIIFNTGNCHNLGMKDQQQITLWNAKLPACVAEV